MENTPSKRFVDPITTTVRTEKLKKKVAECCNISDTDAYNLGLDTLIERSIGALIKEERGNNGSLQHTFEAYLELRDREIREEMEKRDLIESYVHARSREAEKLERDQEKLIVTLQQYPKADLQFISNRLKRAKFNPDLAVDSERILNELEAKSGLQLSSDLVIETITSLEVNS